MANRHLSRSIVLQTLFEWDFMGGGSEWGPEKLEETLTRNLAEFGPGLEDDVFVFNLTKEVLKKRKVVDEIIEKAAPDWPIDKISPVERTILLHRVRQEIRVLARDTEIRRGSRLLFSESYLFLDE